MRGLIVDYVGVLDQSEEDQEGWRQLLTRIRSNGVLAAILSNDPGGSAADPIREWESKGYVDAVVLSGEIGVSKPEKAAFQFVADKLDLDIRDCVLVDDSIENVLAAVQSGLVGVLYKEFERTRAELEPLFGIREGH